MSLFKKNMFSFYKTKNIIRNTFSKINFSTKLKAEDIENIEECLLLADVGWELTESILNKIKNNKQNTNNWEEVLTNSIKEIFNEDVSNANDFNQVIILVGVNGSGKTTTAAKLANFLNINNNGVTLVGADTFRAAAVNQLKIWSERLKIHFVSNSTSSDPAAITYDGIKSGISKKHDYIIIDTAGRLHTSKNLMNELKKIYKTAAKLTDNITVAICLDANIGQNAIKQVKEFNEYLPLNTIILNKMDGTAKGGIVLSIFNKLKIPISYLGIGETYDDIIPFSLDKYLNSIIKKEDNK